MKLGKALKVFFKKPDVVYVELNKLNCEVVPGDIIIIKSKRFLSSDHVDRMRKMLTEHLNIPGVKVLVLEGDFDLTVLQRSRDVIVEIPKTDMSKEIAESLKNIK